MKARGSSGTMSSRREGFTLFVSGSDTGVGKTHVVGAIARALANQGYRLEIVKPVETGVRDDDAGDARRAAEAAGSDDVNHRTLVRFRQPLAPLASARAEGRRLSLARLLKLMSGLPAVDFRLVEGAGGLAVPLDADGRDWADFAREIRADATLLVVEDRLGAINQARLLAAYAKSRRVPRCFFLLNRIRRSSAAVHGSNQSGLRTAGVRLFASPQAVVSHLVRSQESRRSGKGRN